MAPLSSLLTLCALVLSVNAFPAPESYRLHEERSTESIQWEKRSRVKPDILLPVRIGLTQSNLDNGPTLLDEVSNPDSPRYGEHYTMEEIHDIFAPTSESVEGVKGWLQDSGVHPDRVSQSVNKQWIQFDAPVHEVENLLQTEYFHYEHLASGKSNIGCDRYHVPGYLTEHVDYITPGLKLLTPSMSRNGDRKTLEKRIFGVTDPDRKPTEPLKKPLPQSVGALLALDQSAACQQAITPDCIFTMYNITQPNKSNAGNKLGIFESLGDKYAQQDLNSFFATIAPQIPQGTHPVLEAIDGATAPATTVANAGAESNLDIEISLPLVRDILQFCMPKLANDQKRYIRRVRFSSKRMTTTMRHITRSMAFLTTSLTQSTAHTAHTVLTERQGTVLWIRLTRTQILAATKGDYSAAFTSRRM